MIATLSTAATTMSLERRKLCKRSLSRNAASRLRHAARSWTGVTRGCAMRSGASCIALNAPAEDAYARIDAHVDEIDHEIDEYEHERHQHEIGCHYGDVGVLHRLDE